MEGETDRQINSHTSASEGRVFRVLSLSPQRLERETDRQTDRVTHRQTDLHRLMETTVYFIRLKLL